MNPSYRRRKQCPSKLVTCAEANLLDIAEALVGTSLDFIEDLIVKISALSTIVVSLLSRSNSGLRGWLLGRGDSGH